MNADTVQHGSFWGFKVFTITVIFFPVFVSFFFSFLFFCKPELIQHNSQVCFKDTVFTDLVHTERKTYYRKENSLKVWIFLGEKQSPAVISKICVGSKTFPGFVVIFTPFLIKTLRLWQDTLHRASFSQTLIVSCSSVIPCLNAKLDS